MFTNKLTIFFAKGLYQARSSRRQGIQTMEKTALVTQIVYNDYWEIVI